MWKKKWVRISTVATIVLVMSVSFLPKSQASYSFSLADLMTWWAIYQQWANMQETKAGKILSGGVVYEKLRGQWDNQKTQNPGIEGMTRTLEDKVQVSGKSVPTYTTFQPANTRKMGLINDARVMGSSSNVTYMTTANQAAKEYIQNSASPTIEKIAKDPPDAPMPQYVDAHPSWDDVSKQLVRYTGVLAGNPLDIELLLTGVSPVLRGKILSDALKIQTQKKISIDVAYESVADMKYAVQAETDIETINMNKDDSATTVQVLKDIAHILHTSAILQVKILKEATMSNMIAGSILANQADKSQEVLYGMPRTLAAPSKK